MNVSAWQCLNNANSVSISTLNQRQIMNYYAKIRNEVQEYLNRLLHFSYCFLLGSVLSKPFATRIISIYISARVLNSDSCKTSDRRCATGDSLNL